MGLYIQHGYGKSDKVETAISEGIVQGIILSPRDEKIEKMEEFIKELLNGYENLDILFDPQFYATTIIPLNAERLIEYPYFYSNLTRKEFSTPSLMKSYVVNTLEYQKKLGLNNIVSPTILVDDFNGPWSQIALGMAFESADNVDDENLYVSLCIDQNALRNEEALEEYLDMLSTLEVHGFYLTIQNEEGKDIDEENLVRILYLCYVLSNLNQYDVIMGYSDILGVPLSVTSLKGIGSGWFNGLNTFTLSRFMPSSGGRRPNPRYMTSKLMNKILLNPEMQAIYEIDEIDTIFEDTRYDSDLRVNPASGKWSAKDMCLHNWIVLDRVLSEIELIDTITERINKVLEIIECSLEIYDDLSEIPFGNTSTKSHLLKWKNALLTFRENEGI